MATANLDELISSHVDDKIGKKFLICQIFQIDF